MVSALRWRALRHQVVKGPTVVYPDELIAGAIAPPDHVATGSFVDVCWCCGELVLRVRTVPKQRAEDPNWIRPGIKEEDVAVYFQCPDCDVAWTKFGAQYLPGELPPSPPGDCHSQCATCRVPPPWRRFAAP